MLHPNENRRKLVQGELLRAQNDPRRSNRGVIDPSSHRVWSHLDYFSATYPAPVRSALSFELDHFAGNDLLRMQRETKGIRNYRYGAVLEPSGYLFWNETDSQNGSLLVLAGADLSILRSRTGATDDELLRRFMRNAITVSRLDFAINIEAGNPRKCMKEFDKKRAKTRVKAAREIRGHGSARGVTEYFGSTSSHKMLRVYDKAAELKQLFDVLTRIELQTRKTVSTNLAKVMLRSGVKDSGKTAIRDFCDFPKLDWYQQAVDSDTVAMELSPAKETSFDRWLNEQVLPAIEKRIRAGEETGAINRFTRALMGLYGEIGSNEGENGHGG